MTAPHSDLLDRSGVTVLNADDSAAGRYVKSRILTAAGYRVLEAGTGAEALRLARECHPTLALIDVKLPDIDGLDVCRSLKGDPATASIMVLLISARAVRREDKVTGLEEGADGYLVEPVEPDELLATVRALLRLADSEQHLQLALKATRESDERYRRLVQLMPAAMYVCDREGRISFFNEKAVELWGRAPNIGDEDHKFCGAFKLFLPDGSLLPHDRTPMAEAIRNGTSFRNQDVVIERPDGSRCHVLVNIDSIKNGAGAILGAINVFTDVTARTQTEMALAAGRRRQDLLHELANAVNRAEALHDLYEKALDAILPSLDADRASILLFDGDGVMRFKAWRGLSDEYRRAVEGHSPWTREQQDPDPIAVERVAASAIEPELQTVILKEGIRAVGFIPLKYGGRLLGKFMVYFNRPHSMTSEDLSLAQAIAGTLAIGIERKRAEEALRESEERFRLATTTGKVGVWEWDIVNDAVVWTESLYRIHGIKPGGIPMTVEGFSTLVHPDDRPRVSDAIEATLQAGAPYELEFRCHRPDGEVIWLFTSAVVLRDGGRPVRIIGATVDITASKRAAEQLKTWNVELERRVNERTEELVQSQERLRALATELNLTEQRERKRMAAELHDHLAQMLVLGRLKLSQAKRVPMLAKACEELITQTEGVLDDSLQYTRTLVAELSPPVLHDFGLPAALKWLGEHMRRHDLTVSVNVPDRAIERLPEDQAMLLFQSVRELLMNAHKHAQSGRAAMTLKQANGVLRITVRDDGVGFDLAAAAAAAADTAPTALSSKFGLFSIRERMRALGGSFEIESAPGKGTTATLTLPLGSRSEPSSTFVVRSGGSTFEVRGSRLSESNIELRTSNVERPQQHARIRVLLVDDHAMVRQGLRSVLDGYADLEVVGEAIDGAEAVRLADRLQPALIVMDINMPRKNGIEATTEITARWPQMVVIGLSVQANGDAQEAMRKAGAALLLTKEAAVDQLYEAIRETLKR